MVSLERVYLLNEGSQDAGSKTLTLKKKCESIKPYALCYATDMAFLVQTLRKRRVAKIMILRTYFLLLIFSMVIVT